MKPTAHLTRALLALLALFTVLGAVPAQAQTISNSGFSTPTVSPYQYQPTGGSWTFGSNAGISSGAFSGSGFTVVGPHDGQFAFLQTGGGGSVSQSVTFSSTGTFVLRYRVAGRDANTGGPGDCTYSATISGGRLTANDSTVSGQTFTQKSHVFTITSTGTYTLSFTNTTGSGDNTCYIDTVSISAYSATPWISTGSMGAARYRGMQTLLPNGKVLAIGGSNGSTYYASAELYEPVTGAWTATGSMAAGRDRASATLLPNGTVLVVGGNNGSSDLASAELYDPATGTWTTTGSLNSSRREHTATLLPNGKVLVAGGYGGTSYRSSAELYDPAAGRWTTTGSLATGRREHTATLLANGKVLVTAGYNGSSLTSAELYDPAAGMWTAAGSLAVARYGQTATLLPNGKVLVAAGYNGVHLTSAQLYDPATGTWTTTGSLATARFGQTQTLLPSGKVLVSGGNNSGGYVASAELYDPATGTWTATGNMASGRQFHQATLLPNGKVLVAGGNNGSALTSATLWDSTSGAGTWAGTDSLATARQNHTATLLPNGKVLVAAGYSGSFLASAELYDPAGTWTATGSLATARQWHTATLLPNGKMLVVGGYNGSSLASAELYNPATGTWTATGSLATARYHHTATLLPNGKVLVAGGTNGGSSAELYDPATGTWTASDTLGTARQYHTATLLPNGKVLVAGGFNGSSGALAGAELYDPASGTWTATGSLVAARYYHTATLLPNGKVLVAGGNGGSGASSEFYDSATGTWTATDTLNYGRQNHTATLLPNGKVLLAGGFNGSTVSPTELYHPATGTWTGAGSLGTGRYYHTATLLPDGKVLVAGGYNGSSRFASAELYDAGLGYSSSWQPAITSASFNIVSGKLALGGTGFTGISGGSGGSYQDSPTNFPVVQLRSLDNEQTAFLARDEATPATATSFTSAANAAPRGGYLLATVYASGVPSTARIVFYSAAAAPTVTTGTASSVASTSATLNGTVNAGGASTTVTFQYGLTTSYGQTATAAQSPVTGTSNTAVSAAVSGLSGHTTYHFRAVGVNSVGTANGSDATFTTANSNPTAPAGSTTGTTGDSKTVTISFPTVDADGDAVSITSAASGTGVTVNSFTATSVTFTPGASFTGNGSFTYTVSDGFGGSATGTITVTVTDNDAPVVAAHANVGPIEATSASGATVAYAPASASDNVGVTSLTYSTNSGTTFPLGTTTVMITAKDAANNTGTGTFTVTVVDTTAPTITAPAGGFEPMTIAAEPGVDGKATLPDYTGQAVATDAVGVVSRTQTPAPGTEHAPGMVPVSITATDAAGNTSAPVSFTVTVEPGNTAPTVMVGGTGPALQTLANFTGFNGALAGMNPVGTLLRASDGNYFGMTANGGALGSGTVFRLTPAGAVTTLATFQETGDDAEGSHPRGTLVEGNDGALYGVTQTGGSGNRGTAFKVTKSGVLTTLATFTGTNGQYPSGSLVRASNGDFYGMTYQGGAHDQGTIFRLTAAGALTTLVSFDGINGRRPNSNNLVQGADGDLYGMTPEGGVNGKGTIFKLTLAGVLTTLHDFDAAADGRWPDGSLVLGSDGDFYGITSFGGTADDIGTIFKMTPGGAVTTLARFHYATDGGNPSTLAQGSDGNFYGTAAIGGSHDAGTIFRMTPDGTLTTLVHLETASGAFPSGLVAGNPGRFFGVAYEGGSHGKGTVYKLTLPTPNLTATEGEAESQTGTFSDAQGNATTTLTASTGTVTQNNAAGTWSWSPAPGFDGPATTTVTITATDDMDETATATFTFTATNAPPEPAIVAAAEVDEDAPLSFNFSATDPSAADTAAGFYGEINFGDGSPVEMLDFSATEPIARTHTFAEPGTYAVTFQAWDAHDGATVTRTITVRDVTAPNTFIHQGPAEGAATGGSVEFVVIASEVSSIAYSLDGEPYQPAPLAGPDGTQFSTETLPITFDGLAAGTHTFRAIATDPSGNADPTPVERTWTVVLDPVAEPVVGKGGAVPGAGVADSGIAAGAVFTSFGVPSINDAGDIAFLAKWNAPKNGAIPAQSGTGIFAGNPAALVAKVGDTLNGGAWKLTALKDPVLNAEGKVAFSATLAGTGITSANNTAIFTNAWDDGVTMVVQEGDGADGATDGAKLLSLSSFSLQGAEVLYTARLIGGTPLVTSANNRGAYTVSPAGSAQVVRTGQPFGATTVKSFSLLTAVSGSPAQNRAHPEGNAAFLVLLADGTQALVDGAGGTLTAFAQTGQLTGGTALPDATFKSFGPVAAPDATYSAMISTLTTGVGGVTSANAKGIFLGNGSAFEPVARITDDTGITGAKFSAFKDPVLAPATGALAFPATIKGLGAVTSADDATLWWRPAGGPLTLLAREGADAAEAGTGAKWKTFTSLAIAGGENGGPLFHATLLQGQGGVDATNDAGLWAVDSLGALRLLVREGDVIEGRTVKSFTALTAVSGSPGVTRSFNNAGQITYRAIFTDASQAIVTVQVP